MTLQHPVGEKPMGYFYARKQEDAMEIKCDNCGAVAETIEPRGARDGDIEYTLSEMVAGSFFMDFLWRILLSP